jgi:hypothetical protein
VRVSQAGAGGALRPEAQGVRPLALARGPRPPPLAAGPRCGGLAGASPQPARSRVAPWDRARGVAAGAAPAAAARGQRGTAASRACRPVGARLGQAQRRDRPEEDRCLVLAAGRLGRMLDSARRTASPEEGTPAASRRGRRPVSLGCKRTRGQAHCSITAVLKRNPTYPGAYAVLPPPSPYREGPGGLPRVRSASAPRKSPISGLHTLPARSPVNASRAPLPKRAHDSGPAWWAQPSLSETCTLSHSAGLSRHTRTPRFRRRQWPKRGTSGATVLDVKGA